MTVLRIAGAALNQTPFDHATNLQNILQAVDTAKKQAVDILCLPELCITGYGCEDVFLSESLHKKALELLENIVRACSDITVNVGLPIKFKDNLYNCACLIRNSEIAGFSAKRILPNDDVYYEYRWFTPWEAEKLDSIEINGKNYPIGDQLFEVNGIKIAFEICEDAWHDDRRPGNLYAKKGVDLILNPSASRFYFGKTKHREDVTIGGSKKFDCAYLYANLLGNESGRIIFDGEILIAQNGKLIQRNNRLSFRRVELIYADINFSDHTQTGLPPLNDDEQDRETEYSEAVTLGMFDYIRKSRSKGFVLSLSGGADSSMCAVLAADMVKRAVRELGLNEFNQRLGLFSDEKEKNLSQKSETEHLKAIVAELLTCVYQATENSSEDTFLSAEALAESLGAKFYHVAIDNHVKWYTSQTEKLIGRKLTWETDDLTLQNVQARARVPIVWMLANIENKLLITTSNRSEGDVGYATMDGDMAGGLAPLAGIDKDFVRQWLLYAEKELGYEGLKRVNKLQPAAELRPLQSKQTDEGDLMPYELMVQIERLAIGKHLFPVEVYKKLRVNRDEPDDLLKKHIATFFRKWSKNQWKRERLAPSFIIDRFGIDPKTWCRFPILSGGFEAELKMLKDL